MSQTSQPAPEGPGRLKASQTHPVSQLKTAMWARPESGDKFAQDIEGLDHPGKIHFNVMVHEVFDRHLTPGQRVLDVGCGTGATGIHLHDRGCQVVCCDSSLSMLDTLRRRMGERGIELRQGSAFALPAADQEFDAVVSRMFLTHFPDWYLILREFARVVRPGGLVIFTFANAEHYNQACQVGPVEQRGFVFTPEAEGSQFSAHMDGPGMRMLAQSAGLDLLEVVPGGLFYDNAFFCAALGADGFNQFKDELSGWLKDEKVQDFVMWLERTVVRRLPAFFTYHNVTVLRRRETQA